MPVKHDATIRVDGDFVTVLSPYHERFLADLKEVVPPEDRMWVPEEKAWEVSIDYYDEVLEVASRYFNVKVEIANV